MFLYRLKLFSLLGFDVFVDASWLLLAALISWTLATSVFPDLVPNLTTKAYWWMGTAATLGLFGSIVFHELMHSMVARRFKMPIRGITLFIFGGVAEMGTEATSPKGEFLMAAAGPIASLALSVICFVAARALGGGEMVPVAGVLAYLGTLNRAIGLFNLAPAFPLDGGRILRAALWAWRGDIAWATRIAAAAGNGFGALLIALGLVEGLSGDLVGGMWLFLIGLFVRGASGSTYQQTLARRVFGGHRVAEFMTREPIAVTPDLPILTLVENFIYRYHHKAFPVVSQGRLVGSVEAASVARLARDEWDRRTVADIMVLAAPDMLVAPDADVLTAIAQMQRAGKSRLLVASQGHLVGILSLRDLLEFLALKLQIEGRQLHDPGAP